MTNPPDVAVHRFARAANRRIWLGRALQGLAGAAGVLAAAVLGARVLSVHLPPSWWWGLAALPGLLWASWRLRRERLSAAAAAVHLDRRLGLDGLLLTATAGRGALGPQFAGRVARALPQGRLVLPVLRWRRVLPPPLLAAAVLALCALLPEPAPPAPGPVPVPALQLAVERLDERLERLERGHLPEDVQQELDQRLDRLRQQLAQGEVPEWSEIDRLDARIEREGLLQQLRAEEAARAAQALQAAGDDPQAQLAALAEAARALAAAGMLDGAAAALPEALRDAVQQLAEQGSAPGSSPDAAALAELARGLDAAALAQLAEALGRAAAAPGLEAGQLAGMLDAQARRQLAELLAQRPRPEHEHGPECAGGT